MGFLRSRQIRRDWDGDKPDKYIRVRFGCKFHNRATDGDREKAFAESPEKGGWCSGKNKRLWDVVKCSLKFQGFRNSIKSYQFDGDDCFSIRYHIYDSHF